MINDTNYLTDGENIFEDLELGSQGLQLSRGKGLPGINLYLDEQTWKIHISGKIGPRAWINTLGYGFGTCLNVYHHNMVLAVYHKKHANFFPAGVYKTIHTNIAEAFYEKAWDTVSSADIAVNSILSIPYVGKTSFEVSDNIYLQGHSEPCVRFRNFFISIDKEGKPCNLPVDLRQRVLDGQHVENKTNIKSQFLSLPDEKAKIYSSIMVVTQHCIDMYNHSNYKMYIIKAFHCIREMHADGILNFSPKRDFPSSRVKDVFTYFESASVLGELLVFDVYKSRYADDSKLYVTASRGGRRLLYCAIEFYDKLVF